MKSITNSTMTAERKTGATSNTIARRSMSRRRGWKSLTDAELVRAIELMIAPADLTIRSAALAVLKAFGYTPEDVRDQLDSGEYLNDGAAFDKLATDAPRIIYPEA